MVSDYITAPGTRIGQLGLTTCCAAGLRISEAIRLKPGEIDSRRMVVRVEQSKGR